jgi:carbon storage regulator
MLLLKREIDETIVIDGDITITVMDVQNGQLRCVYTEPEEVKVYHEEIYKRMQAEADNDVA